MNELVQNTAALPANFGENLMRGIAETRATMPGSDAGKPLLKLLKTGQGYVYGQENIAVEEGSHWAVNLASLSRGWVCWGKDELQGQKLGEITASVQVPQLPRPADIQGFPFEEQFGMELTCVSGEDDGQLVLYRNHNKGFTAAFGKLISDIRERWSADPVYYWPVLDLGQDSYMSKKFGQQWKPILTIVAWCDAEGNYSENSKPKLKAVEPQNRRNDARPKTLISPTQEELAALPRRGRPPKAADEESAPQTTQQAHIGQRRRPAR